MLNGENLTCAVLICAKCQNFNTGHTIYNLSDALHKIQELCEGGDLRSHITIFMLQKMYQFQVLVFVRFSSK